MYQVLFFSTISAWQILFPLWLSAPPPVRQTAWQIVTPAGGVGDFSLTEDASGTRVFRSQWTSGSTGTYVEMNGLIFYMQSDPRFIQTVDAMPNLPPKQFIIGTSEEFAPDFTWESLGVTDQTNFWIGDTLHGLFEGQFRTWDEHAQAVNAAKEHSSASGRGIDCPPGQACGTVQIANCNPGTAFCISCNSGTGYWCPNHRTVSHGKYGAMAYVGSTWYCCAGNQKVCTESAECLGWQIFCSHDYPNCLNNYEGEYFSEQLVTSYVQSTTVCAQ
jgi:hypothetical protein